MVHVFFFSWISDKDNVVHQVTGEKNFSSLIVTQLKKTEMLKRFQSKDNVVLSFFLRHH